MEDAPRPEFDPSPAFVAAGQLDLFRLASAAELRTAVIVSTYNRAAYLGETLRSLLDQTLAPVRVIVVDDGSSDDTRAVVEGFGSKVEYRRQANSGKATALNLALAEVVEPFVWVFDDDDVAVDDALERMTRALASRPDCDFAYGDYDMFRVDPQTNLATRSSAELPDVEEAGLFTALLERCFVFQGGMLVRRSAYADVGAFDESLIRSQDYDMLLRLARCRRGVRVENVLFHQRQHDGPRGTSASPIRRSQIENAWRSYDERIFTRLHAELELDEYVPGDAPLDEDRTRLALARRCVVYARKNMWEIAAESLVGYVARTAGRPTLPPSERAVFARVFDTYSRADVRGAERFLNALSTLRPLRLRAQLRASILTPLNYRLRLAVKRRSSVELMRYVNAFGKLSRPMSLPLHIYWTLSKKISRSARR